jgi:hypothetical protein
MLPLVVVLGEGVLSTDKVARRIHRTRHSPKWLSVAPAAQRIRRARYSKLVFRCHMSIDHRRRDVGVAEELLNRSYVVPPLYKVRGEAVPAMPSSA